MKSLLRLIASGCVLSGWGVLLSDPNRGPDIPRLIAAWFFAFAGGISVAVLAIKN